MLIEKYQIIQKIQNKKSNATFPPAHLHPSESITINILVCDLLDLSICIYSHAHTIFT